MSTPTWLPTAAELDLADPSEVLPAMEELETTAVDRTAERRWFLAEHLAGFGDDICAAAEYARALGLYPARASVREIAKSLCVLAARMDQQAA